MIYDFKDLSSQQNWNKTVATKKGKKSAPVGISKIKQILILKEKPNEIQYSTDFEAAYETLVTRKEKEHVDVKKYNLIKAYKNVQGIPAAKKKDLLSLCENNIIPTEYHQYFKLFPTKLSNDQDESENED